MDQLKKLRDATFAPMKDCKDALVEAQGDFDAATEILKKKGILKAGKKADRDTNEGLVKFVSKDGKTVGIKLLCETDFVAKNDSFQQLMDALLEKMIGGSWVFDSLSTADQTLVSELSTMVAEFVGKIGENVQLGDIMVTTDQVYPYNHPGNKVATLVYYRGDDAQVAKEVALQVAAMDPQYLSVSQVPAEIQASMRDGFRQELLATGKPEQVVEQILAGKLSKAYADFVLLEQEYIRDASKKIKEILPAGFEVIKYVRYAI